MLWFCFGNKFDFTERVMTDFEQNHCDTQGYISTSSQDCNDSPVNCNEGKGMPKCIRTGQDKQGWLNW